MLVKLLEGGRRNNQPLAKCEAHALSWAPCFPQCVLHSLSFRFIKAWLNSRFTRNKGVSPSKRILSPCFPVPHTSRSSENNEKPSCTVLLSLHNFLKFLLSQINQATAKHRSRLKCHLLGCCGIWEQSYFHTICFFMINYFVTRVYKKMYRENVRWISFTSLTREATEVLF